MTKLLACSDIHNNIKAVRQLRAREGNDYDAVIVAGDLGSENTSEIFALFQSFECPVLYVYGNWDRRLEHDRNFGERCHHMHLSPARVGGLSIVGESIDGIDREWEAFRSEIGDVEPADVSAVQTSFRQQQREKLRAMVEGEGPERTIVVSHYRITKTQNLLPGVPLFLFGHIHRFEDRTFRGQRFVNVSALDNKVMVAPRRLPRTTREDYRLLNDGSYVVVSHEDTGFAIEPKRFDPDFSNWARIEGIILSSAPEAE